MKKITLIMLVAMVPFLTVAQKRGKKPAKIEATSTSESVASYEFMIITGRTVGPDQRDRANDQPNATDDTREEMAQRVKVKFDYGGLEVSEKENLARIQYRSMSHAVNTAARYGWEFINASVQNRGSVTIHNYYMRRNK